MEVGEGADAGEVEELVGSGLLGEPRISKMERPSCRGGPDSVF